MPYFVLLGEEVLSEGLFVGPSRQGKELNGGYWGFTITKNRSKFVGEKTCNAVLHVRIL